MPLNLDDLLNLAIKAASSTDEIDQQIDLIQSYFTAFTDWMENNEKSLDSASETLSVDKLNQLNNQHQAVLKKANKLKEQTKKDLIAQHAKGKGIMTYTDILPKRIRVTKQRKG
ncbi:MAG: hypothetical protein R3A13_09345 [Bdellovibrionota bacterium]